MRHIHIIGIAGTFMGGLARLAQNCGFKVTGCDSKIYPPMSTQLQELGIEVIEGFGAEQLALKPDCFVIGNIAKRGMPLIEAILNRNEAYTSGPAWLYQHILRRRHVLAVAGTHGKTTTASMLAWILDYAGYNPGWLIGGVPENFGVSARLSADSPYFVIEADEYDTAFFDKRSKFVHYHPRTLIINNIEYDHADIFPNLRAILTQFHHLIRTVPGAGQVIYPVNDRNINKMLTMGLWSNTLRLNDKARGFALRQQKTNNDFVLYHQGEKAGEIHWNLMGKHNQGNAQAAIAAAFAAGVPTAKAAEALSHFVNVKRRLEIKDIINNITVYDDFAHHPTEIKATLAALRAKIGKKRRLIAIFEPRSNTMKMGIMQTRLADAFHDADHVFCFSGAVNWDIDSALQTIAAKTTVCADFTALITAVAAAASPGDHLVIMSNGAFNNIQTKLPARLREANP